MNQIQIENPQRRSCRGARTGLSALANRRVPAPTDVRQPRGDTYSPRSPGSQARATDAVINEYARGVATTRSLRA
jgi:hypothetical protein